MENSEPRVADISTPGQRLREARERVGISPREMADRLNWSPGHVSAIEEDRYETLRNTAFVRGYLRAYARELGLDGDALVRSFDDLAGGLGDREQTAVLPTSPASNQKTGLSVAIGLLIGVLVVVLIWWQTREEQPVRTVTAPAAVQSGTPSASPAPVVPVTPESEIDESAPDYRSGAGETAGAVTGVSLDESGALPPEAAQAEETTGQDVGAVAETALDAAGEAEAEAPPVEELTARESVTDTGEEMPVAEPVVEEAAAILVFEFDDDCWLEVRDAEGDLIYADLKRSGDTVRLNGTPPFDILAGNAAAVSLRFRGESFPVRASPGRRKARFTVGDS